MYIIIGLFVSVAIMVAIAYSRKKEIVNGLKNADYAEKVMVSLMIPFVFLLSIIAWPMTLIAAVLFLIFTIAERE